MKEKIIKSTVGVLLGLTVIFAFLCVRLLDVQAWLLTRKETAVQVDEPNVKKDMQLRLRLPEGVLAEQIKMSNDYVTQTLRIEIPHADDRYFLNDPLMGSSDHIEELHYAQSKTADIIEITTDQVFEVATDYDEEYYYLDFIEPHELYEYVVVIDAGHGGNDGGAEESGIVEKNIDLAIVLELKELFEASEENIKVYYTRTDDRNPSYERRVGLANKSNADLFISVHNNSYRDSSAIKGTGVMYSESFEGDFTSNRLAEICMEELTQTLGSNDRGILKGDGIYIVKNSKVPVALIEVGFMTNREELKLLNSEEYQKKAAEAIYAAIFRALGEATAAE